MDGAIARVTHTTSDFGKELDSLADMVTFGVAPAALAWVWGFMFLPQTLAGDLRFLHALGWGEDARAKLVECGAIAAFAFLTAGACRLARFNITLNPQPKNPGHPNRKYFVGMPIPGGAGCLAAWVHLRLGWPVQAWWSSVIWMVYILVCGFLMVSTWRFWSSKSIDFRSRKAARNFVLIPLAMAAMWYFHRWLLFALVAIYMASGIIFRLTYALRRGSRVPPAPPQESLPTL
jgi:CDP-diacylglycerol--serine O-phosphatidyltransferase